MQKKLEKTTPYKIFPLAAKTVTKSPLTLLHTQTKARNDPPHRPQQRNDRRRQGTPGGDRPSSPPPSLTQLTGGIGSVTTS